MASNEVHEEPVPIIFIQCDWDDSLRQESGTAWISCKYRGEKSLEDKICCQGMRKDGTFQASACNEFEVINMTASTIHIKHIDSDLDCIFVSPSRTFPAVHNKSVVSLDVTDGGLSVSACTDNKLQVWDTMRGQALRMLEGHVGQVYCCRFFPSGVVVLSGGSDMQLKIWSAETGKCAVTLLGHTAAITDVCIVDRGRNIISVSKDGLAKLWDCGQSACLGNLFCVQSEINCCSISVHPNTKLLGEPEQPPSEREVGTENKVLILGCENGTVYGVAVHSRAQLFAVYLNSAVNSVAVLTPDLLAVGCQSGAVLLLDLPNPGKPVVSWFESTSAVLSLLPYDGGLFVGKADGTCIYYNITGHIVQSKTRLQLTGPDCDPVYDIATDGKFVYTSCRDTIIRKYDVRNTIRNTFHHA